MRRRRTLSPDERDLWRRVTRDVRPMAPFAARRRAEQAAEDRQDADLPASALPAAPGKPAPRAKARPLAPAPSRAPAPDLSISAFDAAGGGYARKARRGRIEIEGRLDLHGLTQNEAHQTLARFLESAYGRGKRCVLIITGKGPPNAETGSWFAERAVRGVLRRRFVEWIEAPGLRSMIAGATPAHARHGGAGAFYVFLKQKK